MNVFASKLFGSAGAARSLKITEAAVPLHYALSSFRWHQDIRPPMKIIAVHDFLGSSASWEQSFNASMSDLPLSGHSPRDPLEIYSIDLRGHNYSEKALTVVHPDVFAATCAADVVRMQQDVLGGKASVVGIGFGSMVCAAALLHAQEEFSSAVLFVNSVSDLYQYDPRESPLRDAIAAHPEAASLRELNAAFVPDVPNDVDRALVLAMADELPAKTRLRVHPDLLSVATPLSVPGMEDAVCNLPVVVFVPSGSPPSADEAKRFAVNFPHGTVKQLTETPVMSLSDSSRSQLVLQALNVLEELKTE